MRVICSPLRYRKVHWTFLIISESIIVLYFSLLYNCLYYCNTSSLKKKVIALTERHRKIVNELTKIQ